MASNSGFDWRIWFANTFGPGLFGGTKLGDWRRLFKSHDYQFDRSQLSRILAIYCSTTSTSLNQIIERARFRKQWEAQTIQPPVIIIGHWRSGTTHLHNLLAQDARFAFPNLFQVIYPHVFLSTERIAPKLLSVFLPNTRFGLDNVKLTWRVPYEDEFVMAATCFRSPYLSYVWPQEQHRYDGYLTLRDASDHEVAEWRESLTTFLKKLTLKYQKPLILKSPPHTAKIRLLWEMFPDAKFIHIHRHPDAVFRSTRHLTEIAQRGWRLQDASSVDWDDWIFRQYECMFDAFFEQKHLIPEGQFCELSYDQLISDPLAEVRRIYETLALPDFGETVASLTAYNNSLSDYRRFDHDGLSSDVLEQIRTRWQRNFDAWSYR